MRKLKNILAIFLIFALFLVGLSGCHTRTMSLYYSQKENYISASGIVAHIVNNDKEQALYLEFHDLSPDFDDSCFKLVGDNYRVAIENGIMDTLQIGVYVKFISAPKYFGDGYVMPIASIEIDKIVYLTFQDGFANLVQIYNS